MVSSLRTLMLAISVAVPAALLYPAAAKADWYVQESRYDRDRHERHQDRRYESRFDRRDRHSVLDGVRCQPARGHALGRGYYTRERCVHYEPRHYTRRHYSYPGSYSGRSSYFGHSGTALYFSPADGIVIYQGLRPYSRQHVHSRYCRH